MFSWLANAWRVPELRKRLLFTAMILALYRLGSWIPAPGVDSQAIDQYLSSTGGIFHRMPATSTDNNTAAIPRSAPTASPATRSPARSDMGTTVTVPQ